MFTELAILRALLRLSRRRVSVTPSDLDTLLVRVGGTEAELRLALRSLQTAGFIQRRAGDLRLTMAGLAVAVAQIAPVKAESARTTARLRLRRTVAGTRRRAPARRRNQAA